MQHDNSRGPCSGLWDRTVWRSVPIPILAFDHLKDYQRAIQARDRRITFNEVLALVVMEHQQQTAVNGAQRHGPAPLQPRT
jgi:hypothetical protein